MAGVKVNQSQVETTAKSHETARDNIDARLKKLAGDIGNHLPSSKSQLAQAVTSGYEDLQNQIKSKILTDLQDMAEAMRGVAGDQTDTDSSSGTAVTQAAGGGGSPVHSFLSGG